ncbi:MAG: bifunctional glutamate N-acetyltransferase/amino-acid acetyltransferase ArgJ [Acidimicrobiales bacterium]
MSVTAVPGIKASGVRSGLKEDALDLALVATADNYPVAVAGVFTSNKMTAAPVLVSKRHIESSNGQAVAVVLNSGNANAGRGEQGERDAEAMCAAVAAELNCAVDEVLVCSTGIIGISMDIDKILSATPELARSLSHEGGTVAAEAILTTDTRTKEVLIDGDNFVVGGMAKGAAMLRPDMATMLAVLTTNAAVDPTTLTKLLQEAVAGSFNILTVDGAQSTNDTVLVLATGNAGRIDEAKIGSALTEACASLAYQMAEDAEGHTKVVRIEVVGAASNEEALKGARQVAECQLVKCSWYGKNAYWGRVASELGSAGIDFDQSKISVSYGGIQVARNGVELDYDETAMATYMDEVHIEIVCDLGLGHGHAWILTNDLTHGYVDENMGKS